MNELGRIPACVSRYWKIPKPHATCLNCGQKFYHIIAHAMKCQGKEKQQMDAHELIKTWKEQDRPKFPPPKFQIGDWAIYTGEDGEENEKAYMVTGQSLDFYKHSGRFVWYYDFSDSFNGCVVAGDDGDNWEPTAPDLERSPYPPVCECWHCHQIRVDDGMKCVECDAEPTPF